MSFIWKAAYHFTAHNALHSGFIWFFLNVFVCTAVRDSGEHQGWERKHNPAKAVGWHVRLKVTAVSYGQSDSIQVLSMKWSGMYQP